MLRAVAATDRMASGGRAAASAKRTGRYSSIEAVRRRHARRAAAMTKRVQGARYSGNSMRYLPGELRCAAAYCNLGSASTRVKRPTKLFQKNTFKRAVPSVPAYTNHTQA